MYREANTRVDHLAKKDAFGEGRFSILDEPPPDMMDLLFLFVRKAFVACLIFLLFSDVSKKIIKERNLSNI